MNILSSLNTHLTLLGLPVETGVFSSEAPNQYVVVTPLHDKFVLYADNIPRFDVQEARISLFSKENYIAAAREIVHMLLALRFCITERRYHGYEDSAGFHHYSIDVEKEYPFALRN
jgi:hypothetical protein